MQVIFTPRAERHIDSLHEYITTHASEQRADGYVGRIASPSARDSRHFLCEEHSATTCCPACG